MEAVKFVALLVVVVAVQVFGALGFSSDEEDGEVWMVHNWKVKQKYNFRPFFCYTFASFPYISDKCSGQMIKTILRTLRREMYHYLAPVSGELSYFLPCNLRVPLSQMMLMPAFVHQSQLRARAGTNRNASGH